MTQTSSSRAFWLVLGRATWNAMLASVGAYGISLTCFLLVHYTEGEAFNVVALINNLLHLMLLPALALFPLALVLRRWLLVLVLAVPFGVAGLGLAPWFTQQPAPPPADYTEIRVLTYNLLSRQGEADTFAGSLDIIRAADADIVALQEVSRDAGRVLSEELTDIYPHQALFPQDIGTQGQGLLSRFPITDTEYFQVAADVRLGHMRARLDVDGQLVAVVNVHPVHPFMSPGLEVGYRSRDIAEALAVAEAEAEQAALLVLGDFNMTPTTEDYASVSAHYTDVYKQVGRWPGYTFPALGPLPPLARLDYIFMDESWQALDARVWNHAGGADHRPLFARLALLPPTQ